MCAKFIQWSSVAIITCQVSCTHRTYNFYCGKCFHYTVFLWQVNVPSSDSVLGHHYADLNEGILHYMEKTVLARVLNLHNWPKRAKKYAFASSFAMFVLISHIVTAAAACWSSCPTAASCRCIPIIPETALLSPSQPCVTFFFLLLLLVCFVVVGWSAISPWCSMQAWS